MKRTISSGSVSPMTKLARIALARVRRIKVQRRRAKHFKKVGRRVKISPLEAKGVVVNNTFNSSYSSGNPANSTPWAGIGCTTAPVYLMLRAFCQGAIKTLITKSGLNVNSMNEPVLGAIGDVYEVTWQAETGEAPATATFYTGVANYTLRLVADGLYDFIIANFTVASQILQINIVGASNAIDNVAIDMQASYMKMSVDVSMKMQNVTVPSTATDEDTTDDVDAVTLVGESFVGKGSGTSIVRNLGNRSATNDIGFWPDSNGVILRNQSSNQVNNAIPRAEQLYAVSRSVKTGIIPGGTGIAKMHDYYKMKSCNLVSRLVLAIKGSGTPLYFNSLKLGRFSIHCLKREVEPVIATPRPVQINYAIEYGIKCQVISFNPKVTFSTYYINGVPS